MAGRAVGPTCTTKEGLKCWKWTPTQPRQSAHNMFEMYGVHCDVGPTNGLFSSCTWASSHSPPINNGCSYARAGSWELKDPSACRFGSTWGPHDGAGPGAECVMAGVTQYPALVLETPFGPLDAKTVANSGSRYCVKSLPPQTVCELGIIDNLTHGNLPPSGSDTRTVTTTVNCGATPKVTIVGSNELELGPGLIARLSVTSPTSGTLRVTSTVTAVNAVPGDYTRSVVVVVSPM